MKSILLPLMCTSALAVSCGESASNPSSSQPPFQDASAEAPLDAPQEAAQSDGSDASVGDATNADALSDAADAQAQDGPIQDADANPYEKLGPNTLELSPNYAVVSTDVFGTIGINPPTILLEGAGKYELCRGAMCYAHVPVGHYDMQVWDAGAMILEAEIDLPGAQFMFLSVAHHHKKGGTAFSLFPVDLSDPPQGQWRLVLNHLALAEEGGALDFWTVPLDPNQYPEQTPELLVDGLAFGETQQAYVIPHFEDNPGTSNYWLSALPHGTPVASGFWTAYPGCRHLNTVIVESVYCDYLDPLNHDPEGPCSGGSSGGSWLMLPMPVATASCEDPLEEVSADGGMDGSPTDGSAAD